MVLPAGITSRLSPSLIPTALSTDLGPVSVCDRGDGGWVVGEDPHAGDLYVFRGKSGKLIKIFWYDGLGASLYAKRLERGRFVWPSTTDGGMTITPGQLGYLLEGIDWRHPQHTWRPELAG